MSQWQIISAVALVGYAVMAFNALPILWRRDRWTAICIGCVLVVQALATLPHAAGMQ